MESESTAGLTLEEAARRAGLSDGYLRRLLRTGRIVGERRGRRWVVDAASIDRWMLDRQTRPESSGPTTVAEIERLHRQVEDLATLHQMSVADAHAAETARLRAEIEHQRTALGERAEVIRRLEQELAETLAALQAVTARWAASRTRT